ncbi:MAG: VOC family protein [Pseudoruegeria sp.]
MTVVLGRVIIFTKQMDEMTAFYCRHFEFEVRSAEMDNIIELKSPEGGASLLLHRVSDKRKEGQAIVKLVFDIEDVPEFCAKAERNGLKFGPLLLGDGYQFANAKDPAGNSISVSSRAFISH